MKSSATLLALGISDLPVDWQVVSLEDVCVGIFDCPHSTPKLSTDGPYLVRTQDIREGYFKKDEAAHVSMETYQERVKRVVPKYGDILLSREGTYFGDAAEVPKDTLVCLGQRMVLLRPDAKIIRSSFLRIWINSSSFQKYLLRFRDGSVAERLNVSTIRKLPIVVPPMEYQDLVMGHMVPVEEMDANCREINQTLEKIAQTIFKSWFVDFEPVIAKIEAKAAGRDPERAAMCAISGKLEPEFDQLPPEQYQHLAATAALFPDVLVESELGLIPVGWEVKPLDQIADYVNGLALQKFPPESDTDYLPVIKISQLKKGDTEGADRASSKLKPEYIANDGDILFSWSGSLEVDLWCGGSGALNQHLFKVTSTNYPKWFYLYWTKFHLIRFQGIAADKAVTMGHIQRKHLTEALCVSAPDPVIKQLDAIVEPLLSQQIELRKELRNLATLRDTLLPKLLSGKFNLAEVSKK